MAKHNLGMVTAYAYAVAGGYTGTEAEFEALLGNIATDLEEIENLTVTAETLPEGSSATASYSDGVLTLGIPKGDTGATGAGATATAGTTTTGAPGSDASVVNSGTTKDAVFDFTIPRGNTGNGIESITLTSTVGAVHTYTITFTDGDTTTFDVTDGEVTTAALTEILTDYAKTDGAYESMTVGNAEQLISSVYVTDEEPYQFRTSGGSADIGDREFDTLVGGTVAWNQLIKATDIPSQTAPNITGTNNGDGSYTVNGTATSAFDAYTTLSLFANHVYYFCGCPQGGSDATFYVYCYGRKDFGNGYIFKATGGLVTSLDVVVKSGVTVSNLKFYPQIIDLTAMFGTTIADYIYTLEQGQAGAGVAFFRKYFPKSYYPYDAGTIKSVEGVSAHKTVGFNQWDEEWEVGVLVSDGSVDSGSSYANRRTTSFISVLPNTTYYIKYPYTYGGRYALYDANKNLVEYNSDGILNSSFTTPSNAYYLRWTIPTNYGTTYNNDICINLSWDGERNGEYEPYVEHSYPLDDSLTLRGIPKIANGKLYYDGDTYESDGKVTRNTILRAYQSGDESLANAITDGTNTVVYSANASTEIAEPFTNPQIVDDFGTEEYITTSIVPVGHSTKYINNLTAKLEMSPESPSGDGDYIVRQTSGTNEYVPLGSTTTISNIIARLEALENA